MQRRHFLDWARGVAVVAMVLWHTADGWLLGAVRTGNPWSLLRFIGGLAAPSFLFLAGAGAALAARPERSREQPLADALARGLEIMLFGYLLRFQTWMIDGGAAARLSLVRGWLPIALGYGLLFFSLRCLSTPQRAGRAALLGALSCAVGFAQLPWLAPSRLPRLLQVDVLQAIGAALVLLALGERKLGLLQRPRLAIAVGALVALMTELLWSLLPGPLPAPFAAYLGKFDVGAGLPAPALFPLFPWFAYACFGAAFGAQLQNRGAQIDSLMVAAGMGGALLALASSEAHGFVQGAIALAPWTAQPLRVAFRVGLVLVLLLFGWLWAEGARGRLLCAYGRRSLRVYWAHLFVAYGFLGAPWRAQLRLGEWAAGVVLLLALMWLLARAGRGQPVLRKAELSS